MFNILSLSDIFLIFPWTTISIRFFACIFRRERNAFTLSMLGNLEMSACPIVPLLSTRQLIIFFSSLLRKRNNIFSNFLDSFLVLIIILYVKADETYPINNENRIRPISIELWFSTIQNIKAFLLVTSR